MERGADVEEKGLEEDKRPEKTWQQAQPPGRDSHWEGTRGQDHEEF